MALQQTSEFLDVSKDVSGRPAPSELAGVFFTFLLRGGIWQRQDAGSAANPYSARASPSPQPPTFCGAQYWMPASRVVATFHPSSSVISSTACYLTSKGSRHLVVGKLNTLEVYSIQLDKLHLECSYELTGKLRVVTAIPVSVSVFSDLCLLKVS